LLKEVSSKLVKTLFEARARKFNFAFSDLRGSQLRLSGPKQDFEFLVVGRCGCFLRLVAGARLWNANWPGCVFDEM